MEEKSILWIVYVEVRPQGDMRHIEPEFTNAVSVKKVEM